MPTTLAAVSPVSPVSADPALSLLLGPAAAELLRAAVDPHGLTLTAARPVSVTVPPAGGAIVQYAGEVGGRTGRLVAVAGAGIPPGATVVSGEFEGAPVEVGVWLWPFDPALPALAELADPRRAPATLRRLGLPTGCEVTVAVRAYRPGRRAVLEVRDVPRRSFVKVVRPAAVAELAARHELLHRHVPVPPVLAAATTGAVVMPPASGRPLRAVLTDGQAPPRPAALEQLLDDLPGELLRLPSTRGCLHRVADSAAVLRRTFGTDAELEDLVAELQAVPPEPGPMTPVHGDFYEAQLLVEGRAVTGLLDVDSAGPGDRADEWATLLGHLSVAGRTHPGAASYGAEVLAHAEVRVRPADLRRRISAVVLGLATGPFRTRRPGWAEETAARIALARSWIDT